MADGVAPGRRSVRVATKEVLHGGVTVEGGLAGTAKKTLQPPGGVPNAANALAAQTILEDEEFVLIHDGTVPVLTDDLPVGAELGDALYITLADNVLVLAATALTGGVIEAPYAKFGLLEGDDPSSADHSLVNLGARDSF